MHAIAWVCCAFLALAAAACRREGDARPDAPVLAPTIASAAPAAEAGPTGDRPLRVFVASTRKDPAPLVLVLHGYGGDGRDVLAWSGLAPLAEPGGFHVLAPDGTFDSTGRRFWNAVDGCCNFEGRAVDDVAYLLGLVDAFAKQHPVDLRRVYAVGLSNGGAMALRLACDASTRIAAVVSFAGTFFEDATRCTPDLPVSVRHLHGTADHVVPYAGGPIVAGIHPLAKGKLPSAARIIELWAGIDGCTASVSAPALDLDPSLAGPETAVLRHQGCKAGSVVELLTVHGGVHVPRLGPAFAASTWAFLSEHSR